MDLVKKAKDLAHDAADKIANAAGDVKDAATAAAHKAGDLGEAALDKAGDAAGEIKEAGAKAVDKAKDMLS